MEFICDPQQMAWWEDSIQEDSVQEDAVQKDVVHKDSVQKEGYTEGLYNIWWQALNNDNQIKQINNLHDIRTSVNLAILQVSVKIKYYKWNYLKYSA